MIQKIIKYVIRKMEYIHIYIYIFKQDLQQNVESSIEKFDESCFSEEDRI